MNTKQLKTRTVRLWALCLSIAVIITCFSGCSGASSNIRQIRVVTEQSTWDRMNGQLSVLEQAYEESHSNVEIVVEYLPTNEQERDVYLQQLRTDIIQGGGPDCYLLPTSNTLILDKPTSYTYVDVEPLFTDVDLTMRNGLFYDITEFYNADQELDKDGLNAKIMEAGVVNGTRYVLPLRYDIPVIYGLDHALLEEGLDPAVLNQDIGSIMDAVCATGNPQLAGGLLYEGFSVFSGHIDYATGNVNLQEASVSQYLTTYQKLKSLLGSQYLDTEQIHPQKRAKIKAVSETVLLESLDINNYIYCKYEDPEQPYWTEYYPLYIGSLQDAFDYIPLSKYEQTPLTVAPVRTCDRAEIVATVTYYGAVGSGCDNPELAYDFLRQFLLEESQWERNRPELKHPKPLKGTASNTSNDLQHPGLIENGWPVRDKNAVQVLWNVRRKQIYIREMDDKATEEQKYRMRDIGLNSDLTEDDLALFDITIDHVRFNTTMSQNLTAALAQLNDPNNANAPTNADIPAFSRDLVWDLRWHASEG